MKKFSKLTSEQYAALKKHLVLVDRSHFPADDADFDKLPESTFPCYYFDPGRLSEKDEDIIPVTLLGRRNPWNCAQLIAAMMPQILNYIPEEPWYKDAAKTVWSAIRKFGRNTLALIKRIILACRHRDEEEILKAFLRLMMEGTWSFLWMLVPVAFVAGFFKPHCFITTFGLVIVAMLMRTLIVDEFNLEEK